MNNNNCGPAQEYVPASYKTPAMLLIQSICNGHHYTQTNTNNVNKTRVHLLKTGGKNEQSIVLCGIRSGHHTTKLRT